MMPAAALWIAFHPTPDLMAGMNRQHLSHLIAAAALLAAQPAFASKSVWHSVEGGGVRLVTSGVADASGIIRGALEIALKPGWKTYWRDPGDAGVPPTIDIAPSTNIASAVLDYPPPSRFDDGYAVWAGYKEPVALPVTFTVAVPGQPSMIEADVFLGICETICVPVQARLSVDPAGDPDNADDRAAVDAAFAALPGPEQPDFGVTLIAGAADEVLVEAAFAGDAAAVEFFLAASDGYYFGPPERREQGGKLMFRVPILERPAEKPQTGGLAYTLVTGAGAVAGQLPFP